MKWNIRDFHSKTILSNVSLNVNCVEAERWKLPDHGI
jgi:hypothetical protein